MEFKSILDYGEKAPGLITQAHRGILEVTHPYRLTVQICANNTFVFRLFEQINLHNTFVDTEGIILNRNKLFNSGLNKGLKKFTLYDCTGWIRIDDADTKYNKNATQETTYSFEFYFAKKEQRRIFKAHFYRLQKEWSTEREGITLFTDSYGGWDASQYKVPFRSLHTIFMPMELKIEIVRSIDNYFDFEDEYRTKEIPRHYGICLHGPAGSGKSSLIAALAHFYDRDIFYPDISSLEKGSELTELVGNIGKRALLVLEDFDTLSAVKSRDDKTNKGANKFMLSKFLNVMDGLVTPPNLMFIITTNHYDELDPALKRPGRINLTVEMPYLTQDVFNEITRHYYGDDVCFDFKVDNKEIAASVVTNMFTSFFGDPEGGLNGLIEYLSDKN